MPPDEPAPRPAREVVVRPVAWRDWFWLTAQGLSWRKVNHQYTWMEAPLQLYIAPMRATLGPRGPAAVVEVDGRRAGYIGRNPLSGNLEYFLQAWARGGTGGQAIVAFLRDHRGGDRSRFFFVSHKNERSRRALLGSFARLAWVEGEQYWIEDGRLGWKIHVR
jgi:hypothetical protein